MKRTSLAVSTGFLALCTATATATTGIWTGTPASGNWADAANWENAYIPENSDDDASFPADVATTDVAVNPIRTITMPNADVTIGSLSGTAGNTFAAPAATAARTYSFLDAVDFAGTFKLGYPKTISFRASSSQDSFVQRIYADGKPIVDVPDSSGTLQVMSIYGNALFDKSGAGTLRIVNGGGTQTRLNIRDASTVELAGEPSDMDVDSLDGIPAPSSWFDASVAASITTNAEGEVTKWADVRDAAAGTSSRRYLAQCTDQNSVVHPLPTVAANAANGRAAVDFGASGSGIALKLSSDYGNAAELYIAYANNSDTQHAVLWGDTLNKKYNGNMTSGNDGALFSADVGPQVRNGEIRLDGERIWWNDTRRPRGGFHVLSISNSGSGHRFNTLGFQRGGIAGGAKVGEAIVFGSHLTADERRRVVRYLQKKWCEGDNSRSWEFGGVQLAANATLRVPSGRTARVKALSTSTANTLTVAGPGILETSLLGTPPKGQRTIKAGETGVKWNTADPMPVSISTGATLRIVPGVAAAAEPELPADPYVHLDATDSASLTIADGAVTEWRDVRSGSSMKMVGSNSPILMEGEMNGKPVVSTKDVSNNNISSAYFGLYSGSSAISQGTANCREAFVACRFARAGDGSLRTMVLGNTNRRTFFPAVNGGLITGYYEYGKEANEGSVPANADNYVALDGVAADPRTYVMITNDVVLSLAFRANQTWNTLSRWGNYASGGVRYGEVVVYNRSLTPEERRNAEAYLLKKWRGIDVHPENAPSKTGNLSLASGATLSIAKGAGLAAQGGISVGDGATIALELGSPDGTAPLTVTGTASFDGEATFRVAFDGSYGEYPLVAVDAISGNLANLSLVLPATAKGNAKLKHSGGNLILKYTPIGTVLIVR